MLLFSREKWPEVMLCEKVVVHLDENKTVFMHVTDFCGLRRYNLAYPGTGKFLVACF